MRFPTTDEKDEQNVSQFRRFASQFIATTSANWLILDLGLASFFPGIIIPALTGLLNENNVGETLSISPYESSWIGSIANILAPVGCIIAAIITDIIGRKRMMMLSNVPLLIAWCMLCRATSTCEIYVGIALLGLGSGMLEAPVIAYVGEIGEPEFRSFLMAYAFIGMTTGSLVVSILNTFMPWRIVAMVCIFVPIANISLLFFVPESPIWLLSKNRSEKALKSLQWLRGWISDAAAIEEFHSLQRYNERIKSCVPCIKQNLECTHPPPTLIEKLAQLKRQQSLKPLAIVLTLLLILQISRLVAIRPFIVQIFNAYEVPMKPDIAANVLNSLNILANFMFLFIIHFIGKRRLYLIVLSIVFMCTLTMSIYGFIVLPNNFNSFLAITYTLDEKWLSYIPFVCILTASFCTYMGVSSVPSQMMSELLTFRIRGVVTGLIATFSYTVSFIFTIEYRYLETNLSLPGITLLIAILLGTGLFTMYMILPETRNRTLEAIEIHYSDNSKKITNRKIPKTEKPISIIELPKYRDFHRMSIISI